MLLRSAHIVPGTGRSVKTALASGSRLRCLAGFVEEDFPYLAGGVQPTGRLLAMIVQEFLAAVFRAGEQAPEPAVMAGIRCGPLRPPRLAAADARDPVLPRLLLAER
jgi:hypothetical protein